VFGGASHETKLGPFATQFGVLDVDSFVGHILVRQAQKSGPGRPLLVDFLYLYCFILHR
jgi:hypothetical protein